MRRDLSVRDRYRGFTFPVEDDREAYGEQRFLTLGLLEDQVVSVTHTERGRQFGEFPFAGRRNMKRSATSRKSRTDLAKVRRMKDADIVRDGEAPDWDPAMFARAVARKGLKPVPKKALLSLRVDADVVEWFRSQGAGYQSRMNALLRAYMEAHQ